MKTYKTWEVIKELTENPGKEFETIDYHGKRLVALNVEEFKFSNKTSNDAIVTKKFNGSVELLTLNDFMKNRKWKEVRKPVTFIEAVKAVKGGSRVGLVYYPFRMEFHKWELRDLLVEIGQDYEDEELVEIILNGKWYIED